jgi:hypothetical protein
LGFALILGTLPIYIDYYLLVPASFFAVNKNWCRRESDLSVIVLMSAPSLKVESMYSLKRTANSQIDYLL